ncbi:MAG: hypothetical protein MI922_08795, partial [Bacteroidales bacterium]|nr:hypothetical protein [Bacteroidales bacterium]
TSGINNVFILKPNTSYVFSISPANNNESYPIKPGSVKLIITAIVSDNSFNWSNIISNQTSTNKTITISGIAGTSNVSFVTVPDDEFELQNNLIYTIQFQVAGNIDGTSYFEAVIDPLISSSTIDPE